MIRRKGIMKTLRNIIFITSLLCVIIFLSGCNNKETPKNLKDGTYSGRSSDFSEDESGNGSGYGTVDIEVKDNKVVSCTFTLYELDGTLKDDTYGAGLSKENRLKAQKAVQSASKYASMLVEKGTADEIDAISGATICYNEFLEAVKDALGKASE